MDESKARDVWGASPAGTTLADGLQPGTEEFFETVRARRSSGEMAWLAELVDFESFRGKRVLEIGCGAGYDAYDFCAAGADYTGVDIAPQNIERSAAHLGYYGFTPKLLAADAQALPFPDDAFDAVFSNGVLHHVPDIASAFAEASRVLRPGGEFIVIVYNKHSLFYVVNVVLFGHVLRLGFLRRTLAQRRSMIEYTTSEELPIVNVYSRRDVEHLLLKSGFVLENTWVRKLETGDLPGLPGIKHAYRHLPRRWLDRAGTFVGWYVVARSRRDR